MEIIKKKKGVNSFKHIFEVTFNKNERELTQAEQKEKIITWLGSAMLFCKSLRWVYQKPHLVFLSTGGDQLLFIIYQKLQ